MNEYPGAKTIFELTKAFIAAREAYIEADKTRLKANAELSAAYTALSTVSNEVYKHLREANIAANVITLMKDKRAAQNAVDVAEAAHLEAAEAKATARAEFERTAAALDEAGVTESINAFLDVTGAEY